MSSLQSALTGRLYNRYWRFYDWVFGPVLANGRDRAPELLNLFTGARVLEVGVGTGLSIPALPKNIEFTGIDLSPTMLLKARNRSDTSGHQVELLQMDATNLAFPDSSFDRVLSAYSISSIPDIVPMVDEMKRVCRPGGYLLFLSHFLTERPVGRFFEQTFSPLFQQLGFRTDVDLQKLMSETGLEIELQEDIDFLGHWKAVRCINPKKM